MSLIVQKFGGSSVADEDKIRHVAQRIVDCRRAGNEVVAVVSAMGKTTNNLLNMARNLANDPSRRELDMLLACGERISMSLLSMAIQELGEDCISLTGPQAGIRTTDNHFNARITDVQAGRVHRELERNRIVVVAGYQGMNSRGEVTTLGRGGSDTTAVAVAAGVEADRCEIYSDVDGVYTADPRIVDNARPMPEISYVEMTELAHHGASVLNPRAVEYAWRENVEVRARCTFNDAPGTRIHHREADEEAKVLGVACHKELVWVSLRGQDLVAKLGAEVLEAIEKNDIFVDDTGEDGERRDMLISTEDIANLDSFAERLRNQFDDRITVTTSQGSVSAVGLDTGKDPEILLKAEKALEEAGVSVRVSFTRDHSLTCLVDASQVGDAMRALHAAFLEDSNQAKEVA
ncbi:aspartate kinase [Natronospira proteinivora]|uniref:Aspartokinase n=1 Tax=Natronospira proteinivora TaxID=1807133 RepID=A0ABT1GAZ4_9GAMM|nr:aspartate kinase [Natronospira proteinivora]MCP1728496.1 aspartate kinase [Natronospira proteinivora]